MAPVAPFIGLIGTIIGAGATIASTVMNNKQAEKSAKRQAEYQQQALQMQQETVAEEKRLTQEARQRSQAYSASLLDSDSTLNNMLSGGYSDNSLGGSGSLLVNEPVAGKSVESIFS